MSELFGGNMVFPIHNTGHGAPFDEGMSLRDYIAIQAMLGLLNCYQNPKEFTEQALARQSYEVADAMLEHRVSGEQ